MFDRVGNFLSQCSVYLQVPGFCDRNVPYRNPQSLSGFEEDAPLTFEITERSCYSQVETLVQDADPSAVLESDELLAETAAPAAISTPLLR